MRGICTAAAAVDAVLVCVRMFTGTKYVRVHEYAVYRTEVGLAMCLCVYVACTFVFCDFT
jgi:hypothetical protein